MGNEWVWGIVVFCSAILIGAISALILGLPKAKRYPGGALFFGITSAFSYGHSPIIGAILGLLGHAAFVVTRNLLGLILEEVADG